MLLYRLPFARLWLLQSIWQFSMVVAPMLFHVFTDVAICFPKSFTPKILQSSVFFPIFATETKTIRL